MKRKIAVVTGTRADYGYLYWLMKYLSNDAGFELQIVATGMHLSPEHGLTYKSIEEDGFIISEKVEMLMSSDTDVGITKSIGLGVIGFADCFARLKPDLLIVLGDRYEILAAAQAAMVAKIPVAHIAGGDTTEGAYDESIRHCLTKLSHLHFVTNEIAFRRVCQLGENPKHVFNVGSTSIDIIKKIRLLNKSEFEASINFSLREKNLLVTFHPATLDSQSSEEQVQELLLALDTIGEEYGIIFTKPNSDSDSRIIAKMIDEFVSRHPNSVAHTSLGQLRYLSAMSLVNAVVGNSSSGLYEAPTFKIPTVNIGERQKGRLQSNSIVNCNPVKNEIVESIKKAMTMDCSDTVNPYGDGNSSEKIFEILKSFDDYKLLIKKRFYEV